jgi:hypothetical protein
MLIKHKNQGKKGPVDKSTGQRLCLEILILASMAQKFKYTPL